MVEPMETDGSDSEDEVPNCIEGIRIPQRAPPYDPEAAFATEGRLIITSIQMSLFKSFGPNHILGPFHKCFNAVMGPNGNGKSNVIDGILFVFGYRAAKIRSSNLSVLLNNSKRYPNVQSATVTVRFAKIMDDMSRDNYHILPGGEIVISRTANKDNTSYYELNGRRVPFKVIRRLLKEHNIDLEYNRFAILQGEVEQIAMMKCRGDSDTDIGLLEYLEEIIGTTRYKEPLHLLDDKLEIITEERLQKMNRLRLVRTELEGLQQPMKEAVEYMETENRIAKTKNIIYQLNIHELETELREHELEREHVEQSHKECLTELQEFGEQKKQLEQEFQQKTAQHEKLTERKEQFKRALDNADKKDVDLKETMENLVKLRKQQKEQVAVERKKLLELEAVPANNEKTIGECEKRIQELTEKEEMLTEERNNLMVTIQTETEPLQKQKATLESELIDLRKIVTSERQKLSDAELELKKCKNKEQAAGDSLMKLTERCNTDTERLATAEEELNELQSQLPQKERSLNEVKRNLTEAAVSEQRIMADVAEKRSRAEEIRYSMNAAKGRNRVVDALMQLKQSGKCPGIYARLGDLGAIDKKYDVAISTACGALDFIVVEDGETGQKCVEYLKRHDIGRATFIVLEKQEHLREAASRKIQTPENAPRLFDLIEIPNPALRTAFYFALRDTLVAENLDQATRIAYGRTRFRVVTLNGQLIETSGAMSGGGTTVYRGRMGHSVAAATAAGGTGANSRRSSSAHNNSMNGEQCSVEQLDEMVQQLERKRDTILSCMKELEEQEHILVPEIQHMQQRIPALRLEVQQLHAAIPKHQAQMRDLERRCQQDRADERMVQQLTTVVQRCRDAYELAQRNTTDLTKQIDSVDEQLRKKTGARLQPITKRIKETTDVLQKCNAEVVRLRVGIKTARKNAQTSNNKIEKLTDSIANAEERLRAMKAEREEIERDAIKLKTCLEEVLAQMEADVANQNFDEMKARLDDIVSQEKKVRSRKVDVEHKRKELNSKVENFKTKLNQWRAQCKHLKLHVIPEMEKLLPPTETLPENQLDKADAVPNESNNAMETDDPIVTENANSSTALPTLTVEELRLQDHNRLNSALQRFEARLKGMTVNLGVIEEYMQVQRVFIQRAKELDDLSDRRNNVRNTIEMLRTQRKEEFLDGYHKIRRQLKVVYRLITIGGDADFELVDSFDPFAEGVQLKVRPLRKTWNNIGNLSGGEKTLASLSLVFALHYYKPSALYVMDEIDAALDFKNASVIGNFIKERAKNSQFIIISLKTEMYELANRFIGIYKQDDISRSITLNADHFSEVSEIFATQVVPQQDEQPANHNGVVNGGDDAGVVPDSDEGVCDLDAPSLSFMSPTTQ